MTEKSDAETGPKIDRRVARTRGLLQHALITLIMEKGYDAITIEDICEKANVGRSTFYGHYASKADLKRSGMETIRRQIMEHRRLAHGGPAGHDTGTFGIGLPMFEHARDHLDLYRATVGSQAGAMAVGIVRDMLSDLVRQELGDIDIADPEAREFRVQFIVGGFVSVLTWWLDRDAVPDPAKMDAMFRHLVGNEA